MMVEEMNFNPDIAKWCSKFCVQIHGIVRGLGAMEGYLCWGGGYPSETNNFPLPSKTFWQSLQTHLPQFMENVPDVFLYLEYGTYIYVT